MYIKGQPIIATGHQEIFDTIYRDSHNTATIKNIRFLRHDIALAHVLWQLKFRQGETKQERKAMSTMVMTRENGHWSIAAFQNTSVVASE
jgi:uncharacterized protein (TIGR02246 family)